MIGTVGCIGSSDTSDDGGQMTIEPLRVSVAVGDTALMRLVRFDLNGRVLIRGIAPGSTVLGFTLTAGPQSLTGSLPVTVTAAK